MPMENYISVLDQSHPFRTRLRISSEAYRPPMTINGLGEDLLVEILIRGLPNPRSACRGKLVCKLWSSLISNPRFNRNFVSYHQITNQLNHPPMPSDPYELHLIIRNFLPPMPKQVSDTITVLDCNQDLVLCGFWDVDPYQVRERSRSYFVCNPFTKQWIALPVAPVSRRFKTEAKLVCEPHISNKLDLGDGLAFVYSEYRRFRVACLYENSGLKLDVFCSESGEWSEEALVCAGRQYRPTSRSLISCNGELFWMYCDNMFKISVARFNPFCLDMPPTCIDTPAVPPDGWIISSAQSALHVIALENESAAIHCSVWRLEDDGISWRKLREGLVNKTSASECCDYKVEGSYCYLHPHDPEIVFFHSAAGDNKYAILCCDLRREELELFAKLESLSHCNRLHVFQPRFSYWPIPIPRHEELQGRYDGTDSFWTPPIPPSLINCMDRVMKSAFYKDYIEHVTAKATVHMVAEVIKHRQKRIGGKSPPIFHNELDVMGADLADVEADIAILGKQIEKLQQALVHQTAELPHLPPCSNQSLVGREPSRWRVKHILGLIARGLHLRQRNRQGK